MSFTVVTIQRCAGKWKSFGYSCYLFVTPDSSKYDPQESNWYKARENCLKKGADLVSLTTDDEMNFVYSHTKNLDYPFWIGLRYSRTKVGKNKRWAWSNGEKLNFTKWHKMEPNYLKSEHCVEILRKLKYWNNKRCDEERAWICEKPNIVRTQKTKKITGICNCHYSKIRLRARDF